MSPIVIVGAGPAGLTAAITLARGGVECVVLERRSDPPSLPKATGVSLRTMELLRSWGIEASARAGGNDVELVLRECETLADAATGTSHMVGFPTNEQSAVLSPTTPACIPQDHLETVLRAHLESLPGAQLCLGVDVIGLDDDGARVSVRDRHGRSWSIEASYVVAADGARSALRKLIGVDMCGPDHLYEGIHVEFRAPLWTIVGEHRHAIYTINATHPSTVLLPAGRDDRWILGVEWDPARERLADYTDARLRALLVQATGVADLAPQIEHITSFSFAAQVADSFRSGNTFLVGDAAHRITPRGATGMNTAIADAFDVGWKLAWVHKGWATPDLLDSYEGDRRPIVMHNLTRSADPDGSRRPAISEVSADLGGRIAHHWVDANVSTLDLIGNGLTLFVGPNGDEWLDAAREWSAAVPLEPCRLDNATARALGIGPSGATLVRPDGVAVASWSAAREPLRELRATA